MEENKRVYPRNGFPGKWLNYLLLFLSVTLLLSGLLWRDGGTDLQLSLADTPTPIPTDAAFDETPATREIILPTSTWFALQLGAFENEDSAVILAESYRPRGAAGYVWWDVRYRTLAALYTSKDDVQAVRSQLTQKYYIESLSYEISLPALKLRLSGMRGQLDILEAGFLHGQDLVTQLQALSMLMDRQEMSVPQAIEKLQSIRQQMETISLRLGQRFPAPRHLAVQGLMDCFDAYAAFCAELDEGQTSVQLATEIKYQAIAALDALKKIYNELSGS